jgi:hypothetical protein
VIRVTSTAPKARYFVLTSLALGFIDGVTANWLFPGQPFAPSSLVISIAALFLIFLWYRLDSDSREFKRTPLLSIAIVGVAFFAVPYYLFRTRGFRQGLLATLVVLLAAIGYSAVGYVGQLAARAMRT